MTLSAPRGSLRVSFQRSLRSGVPPPPLRRPHVLCVGFFAARAYKDLRPQLDAVMDADVLEIGTDAADQRHRRKSVIEGAQKNGRRRLTHNPSASWF